jgi:feruloyl esterase
MSTDTGHNASSLSDASWGLNNPDAVINWGHRAMHGSVELAKSITNSYYAANSDIQYSYYVSCSTGGRQGLREIQLYPDDFDGASVGAPGKQFAICQKLEQAAHVSSTAWYITHLSPATLKWSMINQPNTTDYHIDPSLFPAIVDEMVKQCDPQDGVTDGIISDPFACNFNFQGLLCTPTNNTNCLTPAQLETVYKYYSDWVDVNQTYVFPGVTLGTDMSTLGGGVSPIGYGYFQNLVYNDPEWDYNQLSYADVLKSEEVNPGNATASDYDLSPFMNRKGKILHYHGTADGLVPTGSSKIFYNKVVETMATKGVELDDFYRFFLIPGMQHCQKSDTAPWYIGGGSQSVNNLTYGIPGYDDPAHNIVLALMNWVENGTAPEQIIATKYYNDTFTDGLQSQRPICVYPKQAKYKGSGDVNDPDSWQCESLY